MALAGRALSWFNSTGITIDKVCQLAGHKWFDTRKRRDTFAEHEGAESTICENERACDRCGIKEWQRENNQ